VDADAWRALHAQRFPDLPFDCGVTAEPGVRFSEELRDWSDKATTPDQRRMERYVDRYDLRQKRILHIGIGNSGFAQRFHGRTKEIVGTTIDKPEMKVARSVALPNYRFVMHNKFSGENEGIEGPFDFILDNNPTSPCCCIRHLATLFDFYSDKLSADGQVVTDRQGLEWFPEDSNPRWSFSFDDLASAAEVAGFNTYRGNSSVCVLTRDGPPPRPRLAALLRHYVRRGVSLSQKVARRVRRLGAAPP
jgi:hypothetical protein